MRYGVTRPFRCCHGCPSWFLSCLPPLQLPYQKKDFSLTADLDGGKMFRVISGLHLIVYGYNAIRVVAKA